jgi:hypothetical protein
VTHLLVTRLTFSTQYIFVSPALSAAPQQYNTRNLACSSLLTGKKKVDLEMAVEIISVPPSALVPNSNARLLRSLKLTRHASAPTSPLLTTEGSSARQVDIKSKQRSFPSSSSSTLSSDKHGLLTELSFTQSQAFRLRSDRDRWRSTAQSREMQLLSAELQLKQQERAISLLNYQNDALRTEHEADVTASKKLLARFRRAVTKHDKLAEDLNDASRQMTQLKKSDRAKGKMWQRNLRLKAALHQCASRATLPLGQREMGTESALQEALAMAQERIEELESKGDSLLEALDKHNDSCGSEGDEGVSESDDSVTLIEAEVAFRGVLKDETFKEQKGNWEGLLNER